MTRRRLLIFGVLLLAACKGPQSALNAASDQSESLFTLFQLMFWICGIAYLLVLLFLSWSLFRRESSDEERTGSLLGLWIGLILIGLTVLITTSFLADRRLALAKADRAFAIRVTGHQWWWRIEYRGPGGRWIETANELHLPAGRNARVELRAADVIHSFWVPNLAGKTDMILGRSNIMVLTPRRAGRYRGQCAEFCGMQHANMALPVIVEEAVAFDRWLTRQARPALTAASSDKGRTLFEGTGCAVCHTVRGTAATGRVGPDLTHLATRSTLAAAAIPLSHASLRGWILNPQAIKPGTSMPASDLSPQDADAVARYLETLK